MPTGQEIIERAGILLNDEDHIRWTPSELAAWINDGVRAIVLAKPSASTSSIVIGLTQGTLQSVPADGTPLPLMLVRLVRNLASGGSPRVGGRIITAVSGAVLDAQDPNWHDPTKSPQRQEARHYVFDEANPLEFYVYPGNTGAGFVEAVVSTLPAPLTAIGEESDPASYAGEIGLPEPYSVPVLDFVLHRAFLKDDLTGNGGRAASHYQMFAAAIGLKIQVEGATSPNGRRRDT